MVFSDSINNSGIVEQARAKARVDSTQVSTQDIVNSCNNWLNKIFTSGKSKDVNFQLDDTNHTKLPIGVIDLEANQSEFSFLVDQQGNRITNITRIDIQDADGTWHKLKKIDQKEIPVALDEYEKTPGTPKEYDLIADNIIRIFPQSATKIVDGLKYYFQRTPSYFVATDTTKEPGVANDLHEGFVVKAAYDIAVTLGLPNLQPLSVELQREEQKLDQYLSTRNTDSIKRLTPKMENNH